MSERESGAKEDRAGAPVPVLATLTLTEEDLLGGIIDMSPLLRAREAFLGVFVLMSAVVWSFNRAALTSRAVLPQVVMFFAVVMVAYLTPRRNARAQLQAMMAAGGADVSYRFDAAGVTIRSAGATATLAYRELSKVRYGKTALLLYTTDQMASIVPLRAFSPDDLARVRAFLPAEAPPAR